jgi:hypothetical protein
MLLALPFLGRVGVWTGILLLVLVGLQLPQGLTHVGGTSRRGSGSPWSWRHFPPAWGRRGRSCPTGGRGSVPWWSLPAQR